MSLLQSLRNAENGVALPGVAHEIETSGNQLFLLTSERLQYFQRDPSSGGLTLQSSVDADTIDLATEPMDGDFRIYDSIEVLDDGRLLVNGGVRSPSFCKVSSVCAVFGPFVLATDDGQFSIDTFSDADNSGQRKLTVSPDGNHAYALSGRRNTAGLSVYSIRDDGQVQVVETLDGYFRPDGSFSNAFGLTFTPDSRLAFVHSIGNGSPRIVTFERNLTTGRLTAVSDIDAATEPGNLETINYSAVSPDGTTLYVGALGQDLETSGLARYAIDDNGGLEQVAIDRTANSVVPGSLQVPREITVSPNGRLVLASNAVGNADVQKSLHLFTVGDDGATTWRGFEQDNRDGLVEGDLDGIHSVRFSSDGAFVYVLAGDSGERVLSAFAAHADNTSSIVVPTTALADSTFDATVTLFNAGPATAHGLVATIEVSNPIASTGSENDCVIEANRATCRVDDIGALGTVDIQVSAATPTSGELSLSVESTQYQVDPDTANNAITATVPVVTDPSEVDTTPVRFGHSEDGGGASNDSGGGCSIGTTANRDPLLALLVLASWFGLRKRRSTSRATL